MTRHEQPVTTWTLKSCGIFLGAYYLMEITIAVFLILFSRSILSPVLGRTPGDYFSSWFPLVGGAAGLTMVVIWQRRFGGKPLWEWRELLTWQSWATLTVTVGLNMVVFLVGTGIRHSGDSTFALYLLPKGLQACFWVGNALLTPALEENIYRGIVQPTLGQSYARLSSVSVTALLFAVFHAPNVWPEMFLHGIVWGFVAERRSTLTVTVLAHAIYNAVVMAIS